MTTQEPFKATSFTTLSAYPRLRSQEQPCQCIDSVILLFVTCTVGFAQRCSSTSTCRLCPAPLHMLATTFSAHRIQLSHEAGLCLWVRLAASHQGCIFPQGHWKFPRPGPKKQSVLYRKFRVSWVASALSNFTSACGLGAVSWRTKLDFQVILV